MPPEVHREGVPEATKLVTKVFVEAEEKILLDGRLLLGGKMPLGRRHKLMNAARDIKGIGGSTFLTRTWGKTKTIDGSVYSLINRKLGRTYIDPIEVFTIGEYEEKVSEIRSKFFKENGLFQMILKKIKKNRELEDLEDHAGNLNWLKDDIGLKTEDRALIDLKRTMWPMYKGDNIIFTSEESRHGCVRSSGSYSRSPAKNSSV
ncbi:hypothetical protein KKG52_03215 [Patescibacteria group bacterium]|nr:hypothetical protein [Patescibacteria group bacterium]